MTPSILARMVSVLRTRGIPSVVDVPGPLLKRAISAGPVFIKPNLVEFREFSGSNVSFIPGVLKEARRITDRVPIVCVSSVEGGALLVTQKSAWFGRTPKVKIRTTVGAGDSMVGAISARLWKWQTRTRFRGQIERMPDEVAGDLLRWGLASACATLATYGTELGKGRAIRKIYPRVELKRVG